MSSLATSRHPEPTTVPWAPETGDLSVSGYWRRGDDEEGFRVFKAAERAAPG